MTTRKVAVLILVALLILVVAVAEPNIQVNPPAIGYAVGRYLDSGAAGAAIDGPLTAGLALAGARIGLKVGGLVGGFIGAGIGGAVGAL